MLYEFEDRQPSILAENYFIADSAVVIGSVVIRNNVCILPNAVIRADNDVIEIRANTNVQDGAVLHTDPGIPMQIGEGVTIAHNAMLHGCTVGNNSVIAIGAVVMNHAVIGNNCIIGANSVVLEGQKIPDNSLVLGIPGKVKKTLSDKEAENMQWFSQHYVDKIKRFQRGLKIYVPTS